MYVRILRSQSWWARQLAIDAVLQALDENTTSPGTVREASAFLKTLATKSPDIRSTLTEKGAITLLGAAMQFWPQDAVNVQGPAQQALRVILEG